MHVDRRIRFEYATYGRENFWIRKQNLRIQKYSDTCGRGLRPPSFFLSLALFFPSSTTTESLEQASLKVPFHTNQIHFHTKGFERGLVLKLRHRVTVLNIQIKISVFPYISVLNKRWTGAAQDDVEIRWHVYRSPTNTLQLFKMT